MIDEEALGVHRRADVQPAREAFLVPVRALVHCAPAAERRVGDRRGAGIDRVEPSERGGVPRRERAEGR